MTTGKKILVALGVGVALLVAAGVIFVATFDANRYRGLVLERLSKSVNRPVEAAELKLQLLPFRLRLNQVRIPEHPSFGEKKEFIRADAVQFEIGLFSLLRGTPEVQGLELDRASVYLRQNTEKQWNVATLGERPTQPKEKQPAADPSAPPVRNWALRQGTIVIERAGEKPIRLTGVELAAEEISATEAFPFRLAVTFPDPVGGQVSAEGTLGPLQLATPWITPATARVKLSRFHPAALRPFLTVPPELIRLGLYEGTLEVSSAPRDGVALAGKLELRRVETTAGKTQERPEETVRLDLASAKLPGDFSRVELGKTTIEYAGAKLVTEGSIELAQPPRFQLSFTTDNADIGGLVRLPARLGVASPLPLPPLSGKLTTLLKCKGTLKQMELNGAAQLRHLAMTLEGFSQALRIASLDLTFEPNRITAAPFQVSPEPGLTLTVSGSLENYQSKPRLAARVSGEEVPVAPLLALAGRFGKSPLGPGQQMSGRVRPEMTLTGPLDQIAFDGTLHFREVSLTAPQLAQPLRVPAAELTLTPTRLSATPFTAQVGDQLRAQVGFRLDHYAQPPGAPARPTLAARIETQNADLGVLLGLVRTLGPDPLPGGKASGQVTAAIDVSGRLGEKAPPLAYTGRAQLARTSLQPAELSEALGIEQATFEFGSDRLEISNLRLTAAGTKAEGSFSVEDFDRPRVRFELRGDRLDLDALQALFAARGAKASVVPDPRPAPTAVYAAERQPANWFAKLTGRGTLNFGRVTSGSFTLAPLATPVAMANQRITCDPVEFGLYEGGGRGRLVIDLSGDQPATEFNGLIRNVDANQLLSANSDSKDRLHGRLGGTLQVWFAGSDRQRITQSARGQGELTLVNGRLTRLNLSRELGAIAQFAGLRFDREDTPIEDMSTQYEIAEGWVRTDNLTLRTPELSLQAAGGFSLTDELALESTATFTPEASQRISSRGPLAAIAGGFFTDEQGRVVIPFDVRGTFAQPKFTLDVARLAEMRLGRGRRPSPLGDLIERLRKGKPNP